MTRGCRQSSHITAQTANRFRGFTLLEVLVALVILSIGLLGLSGLQTTGLRGNHSALLRSEATILANDILDRMRLNRLAALDGSYDIKFEDNAECSEPSCTVADADLFQWRSYVKRLPGGEGQVDVNDGVVTISIRWMDDRSGAAIDPFVTVTVI